MRSRAQQAILKVLPETIVDGQRDNERCYSRSHADHGNDGDDTYNRLAALGAKITDSHKELESQTVSSLRHARLEMNGIKGTAR